MEIHKPKPMHSLREFLTEIGTIICGILIAIGLEQGIEWMHRQEAVTAAREALREEVGRNNGRFAERLSQAGCIDRHIAETAALIEKVALTGRTPHVEGVGLGPSRRIETGAWEAQRAAQTVVHFPAWERSLYSTNYVQTLNYVTWRDDEDGQWVKLAILNGPPKQIGQAMIDELRVSIIRAKHLNDLWELVVPQSLEWGEELGVKPIAPANVSSNTCADVKTW